MPLFSNMQKAGFLMMRLNYHNKVVLVIGTECKAILCLNSIHDLVFAPF